MTDIYRRPMHSAMVKAQLDLASVCGKLQATLQKCRREATK